MNALLSDGMTALIAAADKGHTDVVRALIDAKADVNAKSRDGRSALTCAENGGRSDIIQLLKRAGAR